MTVVAWDGVSMAADRQGEIYTTKTERTKIRRVGALIAGCAGTVRASEAMFQWFKDGARIGEFPKLVDHDAGLMLVAGVGQLFLYEGTPYPMYLENKFFAIGSGGDAAMAAIHLGSDAKHAVEVACAISTGCGGGVDVLTLETP